MKLDVWLFADCTGTLSLVNGKLGFSYSTEWLKAEHAVALSCSLPLQSQPFDDHIARPFFAGLLPEGLMRQLLSKQYGISLQNDFALLNEIGGECAGAVTFVEYGTKPSQLKKDFNAVQWLADKEMVKILLKLPHRPMLAGDKDIRLSLAGAQSKLPVVFKNGRIGLPLKNTPSTHILKPALPDAADSVVNEAFCLKLAQRMKLDAASTLIHQIEDHRFLLVERYDRKVDSKNQLNRIHQEDFCQALAVAPEIKYQNEGGPDLKQCFELTGRVTRPSVIQTLKLLDAVFFNALVGNHDAHAKNFSLLYTAQYPVLAPLYDILCTAIYPNFTTKMAMKIGSKYKFDEVQPRHWQQLAEACGLSESLLPKRLLQFATALPDAARKLQADQDEAFANEGIVTEIIKTLDDRCGQTVTRLSRSE